MLLIQCSARDDTSHVDGVDYRGDKREEQSVHITVGDASDLKITVDLIELCTLETVGPRGVGHLITRDRWDSHILIGEGVVDLWLGHTVFWRYR